MGITHVRHPHHHHAQLALLNAQGITVGTAAASGLMKAVTVAAQIGDPIGAATLAAITAAEATGKPGAEKRADVIGAIAPLVVTEAGKSGVSANVADAEQFAGLVLEEVLASVKQTPVVAKSLALLKMLGISEPDWRVARPGATLRTRPAGN